jgi:hypothetical protein
VRTRLYEATCGALVLAAWVVAVLRIPRLPLVVPTHFGLDGKVDATGSPAILWLLPALVTAMYLFLCLIQRVPESMMNFPVKITERNRVGVYALAREMLPALKVCTVLTLLGVETGAIDASARGALGPFFYFLVFVPVALLFGIIVAYTIRMRRV